MSCMKKLLDEELELITSLIAEQFEFKVNFVEHQMRVYVKPVDGVQVRVIFSPELCYMADNCWYVRNCGDIEEYSNVDDVMDCIRKWRA